MPFWPLPPPMPDGLGSALPLTPVEQAKKERHTMKFGPSLTVDFDTISMQEGTYTFTGDVVAKYLETTLRTSELKVFSVDHRFQSKQARIEDPDAEIVVDEIQVDYQAKQGTTKNFLLRSEGATIRAEEADLDGTHIKLRKASGTTSRRNKPLYEVKAEDVDLVAGQGGTARRIVFSLFGVAFPTLPKYSFSLDNRVTGFRIPDVTNKRGAGVGIGWNSTFLVGDRSAVLGSFGSFPGESPSLQFTLAHSNLDPSTSGSAILPKGDLGEFVAEGWFTNIISRDPSEQVSIIQAKRQSFAVGTSWNIGTGARTPDATDVSKLLELTAETGGAMGSGGYSLTGRAHRIRASRGEPWVDRLMLDGVVGAPLVKVAPAVSLISRLDFRASASRDHQYGFARAETGLAWKPYQGFDLGLGLATSTSQGSPDFPFDAMPFSKALMVRGDYQRGFLTLRGLWRYDFDSKTWFDREYEIAVVADGIEPFVMARSFPNDFRFGLRFRIDKLIGHLTERQFTRSPK